MAKKYAIGLSNISLQIADPVGISPEVDTLTFSAGCSTNGNLSITLNGVAFTVPVTTASASANAVAAVVRAFSFSGWTVTGADAVVVFTANVNGIATAPVFSAASTGVAATFVRTQQGVANPFASSVTIGEVAENSTQFVQEAPTETKFKGDYGDVSLMTLFQNGDIIMETDIIEVSGTKMAALTGANWAAGSKSISMPTSAPVIAGQCILNFDEGFDNVKIHRGQIIAYLSGANLKTEMFKLHLKVSAVPTDSGYVDIVTD